MILSRYGRLLLTGLGLFTLPGIAQAETEAAVSAPECPDGVCHVQLTAAQLLNTAERLVADRKFGEAAPMIAALEHAPQFAMERQFLAGYSAAETGDLKTAVKEFRAALVNHPEQTRIRLELARALMLQGKGDSADHHFRLAGQDKGLPEDIQRTIHASRSILRDQRQWSFNLDVGLAPDSNITNGTSATTIDANFGGQTVPLTLSPEARKQSGTGQTFGLSGRYSFGIFGNTKLAIDADGQGINHKGGAYDDFNGQLAVGPQFQLTDRSSLTVQAIGNQRYFGGKRASTGFGMRTSYQLNLDPAQRLGLSLDARHNASGFADSYSGWSLGANATYERVIARRFIASASLFGRRELLKSASYSSGEFGANIGIGGELPLGITAGISAGVSRAIFDAPLAIFSSSPRANTRLNARVNLGLRSLRILGFSPALTYSFSKSASSVALYQSKRSRLAFTLAHYF